mmetsp:Transcript_7674/g.24378  ORF Transcript_7674/g.24378 Transcript_7674/m.24378 type:complete len:322 (-) Transcript_7674:44-1009(-)
MPPTPHRTQPAEALLVDHKVLRAHVAGTAVTAPAPALPETDASLLLVLLPVPCEGASSRGHEYHVLRLIKLLDCSAHEPENASVVWDECRKVIVQAENELALGAAHADDVAHSVFEHVCIRPAALRRSLRPLMGRVEHLLDQLILVPWRVVHYLNSRLEWTQTAVVPVQQCGVGEHRAGGLEQLVLGPALDEGGVRLRAARKTCEAIVAASVRHVDDHKNLSKAELEEDKQQWHPRQVLAGVYGDSEIQRHRSAQLRPGRPLARRRRCQRRRGAQRRREGPLHQLGGAWGGGGRRGAAEGGRRGRIGLPEPDASHALQAEE